MAEVRAAWEEGAAARRPRLYLAGGPAQSGWGGGGGGSPSAAVPASPMIHTGSVRKNHTDLVWIMKRGGFNDPQWIRWKMPNRSAVDHGRRRDGPTRLRVLAALTSAHDGGRADPTPRQRERTDGGVRRRRSVGVLAALTSAHDGGRADPTPRRRATRSGRDRANLRRCP